MSYYKTKESVDEYIELAKDVNGELLINKLRKHLQTKSSLLEIGSGPGTDWKILNEYYEVVGSDNSKEFLNRLTDNNPEGKFLELDATTLLTEMKYDGIYSNKVFQHLNDKELDASIIRQFEILNSNGIVCHSFWEGEGSEVFKELHVQYYNGEALRKHFEEYFNILLLEKYCEFEDDDSILLIAQKKT